MRKDNFTSFPSKFPGKARIVLKLYLGLNLKKNPASAESAPIASSASRNVVRNDFRSIFPFWNSAAAAKIKMNVWRAVSGSVPCRRVIPNVSPALTGGGAIFGPLVTFPRYLPTEITNGSSPSFQYPANH